MDKETYEKANELYKDISKLDKQIKDVKSNDSWLDIRTSIHSDFMGYSFRFRDELLIFMQNTRDRYQKEFDEL